VSFTADLLRGKDLRFVNAHLESFSPILTYRQAAELTRTAGNTDLPLIMAGDFDADAENNDPTFRDPARPNREFFEPSFSFCLESARRHRYNFPA
jgi:endonuclease/exonuclease/phosphatase family metal-dependent hydrolase